MKLICDTLTQVQPGREHSVKLTATVVSSSGIGDILPEARDCFFTNEGSLEFYEKYTLTNCRLECGIKEAEKVHGCIPWHLPKVTNCAKTCASQFMQQGENSTTCDPWTSRAFIDEMQNSTNSCNHCRSDCNLITYLPTVSSAEFR